MANGKPTLEYSPTIRGEYRKVEKMHVSVSHDGGYVLASVLAENTGSGGNNNI
jgi:holo-[acyl-carrier protein] synthase